METAEKYNYNTLDMLQKFIFFSFDSFLMCHCANSPAAYQIHSVNLKGPNRICALGLSAYDF